MRCEEIMNRDVECISPQETVQKAAQRMREKNLGFLPVCEKAKPIGTLTDRDLVLRVLADAGPATTPVRNAMTTEVVTCNPGDDLESAQELMAKHQKSRIMCVDSSGKLVGVISLSDIANLTPGNNIGQTFRAVKSNEAASETT